MLQIFKGSKKAYTLTEVMIALVIIGILGAVFIVTMMGLETGDQIDRAVQGIYEDMLLMRSRSVSTNRDHRLNFTSASTWQVESFNTTTNNWELVGSGKSMPLNVNLKSGTGPGTYANSGVNLQASPRGLFTLLNAASGVPFVTITALGTSKTKSLNVYVGGAIEIRIP